MLWIKFQHPDGRKSSTEKGKWRRGVSSLRNASGKKKTEEKSRRGRGAEKKKKWFWRRTGTSRHCPKRIIPTNMSVLRSSPRLRPPASTLRRRSMLLSTGVFQHEAYFVALSSRAGLCLKKVQNTHLLLKQPPTFLSTHFLFMLFCYMLYISLKHYNLFFFFKNCHES